MSDETQNEQGGDDWAAAMAEQEAQDSGQGDGGQGGGAQTGGGEDVKPAPLDSLQSEGQVLDDEDVNLDVILDIPVTLSMEIGRTRINIRNLLQLNQGSVVELDRLAGEPLDVMVNGTLIAHGEVVVVNERFGIRLTDVVSPSERVRKLK